MIELLILLLILLLLLLTVGVVLGLLILVLVLVVLLGNNVSARREVFGIIGEQVVLFGVNNGLNNNSGFLTLILQHINYDVHNLGDHRGETLEYLVHDTLAHLL